MSTIHIWSDEPGDWRISNRADAVKHGHSATVIGVSSISDLVGIFQDMVQYKVTVDALDFHTHGTGGAIGIGAQTLDPFKSLDPLRGQGFENLFRTGASIEFQGCSVADGPAGELFLAEIGAIFLKNGGGTVKANSGTGFADPLFTGNVYHPTGTWVTAQVSVGGEVTLVNQSHLRIDAIRKEIALMDDYVAGWQELKQGTAGMAHERQLMDLSRKALAKALEFLDGNPTPPWAAVYWAYRWLIQAKEWISACPTIATSVRVGGEPVLHHPFSKR